VKQGTLIKPQKSLKPSYHVIQLGKQKTKIDEDGWYRDLQVFKKQSTRLKKTQEEIFQHHEQTT
jgi:hypothetical protein